MRRTRIHEGIASQPDDLSLEQIEPNFPHKPDGPGSEAVIAADLRSSLNDAPIPEANNA